jgi:carbon-monoxide dehydrogenase large subunit
MPQRRSADRGVIKVLTGSDAVVDGLHPIPHGPVPTNPHEVSLRNRDGSSFFIAPHPLLAVEAVRYVGEPIAIVIAQTLPEAMDAAERIEVVYEPLAAVARSRDALAPGAPLVWTQHGSNQCIDSETGDFQQIGHVERALVGFQVNSSIPLFDRK